MSEIIKSSQNKTIKHIKSLQIKKYRDQFGEFIIEGEKLLEEALCYKVAIKLVIFSDKMLEKAELKILRDKCIKNNVESIVVEDRIFNELSDTQTPQGVLAAAAKANYDIEALLLEDKLNIIILDEIRDPGNLGTIIRTADACNFDAVVLSKGCVDLYNSKSIRSTMGSVFHLPVIDNIDIESLIAKLNQSNISTIGADPYGDMSIIELPAFDKNAIVIGNESRGMNERLEEQVKYRVKIPMPGKAESLNAGIAAALMMYEISVRKVI